MALSRAKVTLFANQNTDFSYSTFLRSILWFSQFSFVLAQKNNEKYHTGSDAPLWPRLLLGAGLLLLCALVGCMKLSGCCSANNKQEKLPNKYDPFFVANDVDVDKATYRRTSEDEEWGALAFRN